MRPLHRLLADASKIQEIIQFANPITDELILILQMRLNREMYHVLAEVASSVKV